MQYQSHVQKQAQIQTLKILPQQIQFLNLLHLNTLELESHIQKELEENPFLERNEENDLLPALGSGDDINETAENEDDGYDNLLEMRGLDDEMLADVRARLARGLLWLVRRGLRDARPRACARAPRVDVRLIADESMRGLM
mgnify:CR=1 FL=1